MIQPTPARAAAHVLHVDDEAIAARTVHQMLVRLGYRVTSCTSPHAALATFEQSHASIDLVLTDLVMPAMDGAELAQRILALRPGVPVVVLSGFVDAKSTDRLRAIGIRETVAKPIDLAALGASLGRALGKSPPSP